MDTSFRGRFDDPRINDPQRTFPKEKCYRVLYFATERAGAFGEILQKHIPNPQDLQAIFSNLPLGDGRTFTIVKVFYDLADLQGRLADQDVDVATHKLDDRFFLLHGRLRETGPVTSASGR